MFGVGGGGGDLGYGVTRFCAGSKSADFSGMREIVPSQWQQIWRCCAEPCIKSAPSPRASKNIPRGAPTREPEVPAYDAWIMHYFQSRARCYTGLQCKDEVRALSPCSLFTKKAWVGYKFDAYHYDNLLSFPILPFLACSTIFPFYGTRSKEAPSQLIERLQPPAWENQQARSWIVALP